MSEKNRAIQFNPADVIAVAKAHSQDGIYWDEGFTNSRNPHDGYRCRQCAGKLTDNAEDFKHSLDCTILIAMDLITGSESA